jgi:Zn finger protein HypA/HybF involved in hydrogenase expression
VENLRDIINSQLLKCPDCGNLRINTPWHRIMSADQSKLIRLIPSDWNINDCEFLYCPGCKDYSIQITGGEIEGVPI